jgi:hypothetical protein
MATPAKSNRQVTRGPLPLYGRTFGMLAPIEPDVLRDTEHGTYWRCRCACGNITTVRIGNLIGGLTQSCGCLKRSRKPKDPAPDKLHSEPFVPKAKRKPYTPAQAEQRRLARAQEQRKVNLGIAWELFYAGRGPKPRTTKPKPPKVMPQLSRETLAWAAYYAGEGPKPSAPKRRAPAPTPAVVDKLVEEAHAVANAWANHYHNAAGRTPTTQTTPTHKKDAP